jgi:hypothetical protein
LAHYTALHKCYINKHNKFTSLSKEKTLNLRFSPWKGLDLKQLDQEKTCRAWKEMPALIFPGPTEVGDKKRTSRAWKKLPPSILPGPIWWGAKVNL